MFSGIIDGMNRKSLEKKIGKLESEAEQMINDYKEFYPKMSQFLVKTITESGQGSGKTQNSSLSFIWPVLRFGEP